MKNFEKYEKEIKEIVNQNKLIAVVNNKPCVCEGKCIGCKFDKSKGDMRGCIVKAFEWLYEEYKEPIKLSRLEFELLKCLKGEKLEYLARDKCKVYVHAYGTKPQKGNLGWFTETRVCCCMSLFSNCFKFIKWEDEEPYKIQDILDNCEVVDNE